MFFEKNLYAALGLNVLFFFLYLVFGVLHFESLDDYFMSSVLTGAYGSKFDVHLYFINSAYGYFLKPFYFFFPKVGWFFIFELIGTFSAFLTISYFLIVQQGFRLGSALSALILASLTPDFYFQLSFTQCSTLYTAAGMLAIFFGIQTYKKRFLFWGGMFLTAGFIMRYEGFLLGVPYLVLLLMVLLRSRKLFKRSVVIALSLIIVTIFCLREYDKSLFAEGDYKYYADYQPIRAYFGDGAFYDRESTYDELEERGMSGLDFNMLKAWMFYDTEVFYKDSLEKIKAVTQNNLYKPNIKRLIAAFFLAVSNAFTRTNGWCWVILCLLLICSNSRKASFYPWLSLSFIAVSIFYLLLVNRLVYRVESGVWLYAIIFAIPFLETPIYASKLLTWGREKTFVWGFLLGAIVFASVGISNQIHLKKDASLVDSFVAPKDWSDFLNYAKENKDKVFLLSFDRYKEMGELRNPPYVAVGPGDFDNIFSWGYWNIHLPAMKEELAKRGVENPIRDIIHDNVFLMEDHNGPTLGLFYEEHYHQSLWVDTVNVFGNLMIMKYHLPVKDTMKKNE